MEMTFNLASNSKTGGNALMKGYIIDAIQKGYKVIVTDPNEECKNLVNIFGSDKIEIRR